MSNFEQYLVNNLRKHVKHLSHYIGERHLWREDSLALAADYIESCFAEAGYSSDRQNYIAYGKPVSNIIAEKKISTPETIVIGAHYDTVPGSPGADDNASSVAALLELARLMQNISCSYSIEFVAFANEESPSFGSDYMGSMQYAKYLKESERHVQLMIALESIGYFRKDKRQNYPLGLMRWFYPKTADFIAVIGDYNSHKYILKLARDIRKHGRINASALIAPKYFGGIDRSDQMAFWHYGFRALMITDTANFRNPNYHRETDKIDTLDFESLSKVVRGIYGALINLPL